MSADCPTCGGPGKWVGIVGGGGTPRGSRYECEDCGHRFNDLLDEPAYQYEPRGATL